MGINTSVYFIHPLSLYGSICNVTVAWGIPVIVTCPFGMVRNESQSNSTLSEHVTLLGSLYLVDHRAWGLINYYHINQTTQLIRQHPVHDLS